MPRQIKLPEKLVDCKADICVKLNTIYLQAPTDYKIFLAQLLRELRKKS